MSLVNVYDERGNKIDLDAIGLKGLRLLVHSPNYEYTTEQIDGKSGAVVMGKRLLPRDLTVEFLTTAPTYEDSLILRDKVFSLFGRGNLYVSESKLVGKWWKVHLGRWTPERLNIQNARLEIPLIAYSGCCETINVIKKSFDVDEFNFYNDGNIMIDPREHKEVSFSFEGVSENLTIENLTTGDVWTYYGTTTIDEKVELVGIRSLKDNVSIFRDTNKKLITLKPGINNFKISGAGEFTFTISTRFYFL